MTNDKVICNQSEFSRETEPIDVCVCVFCLFAFLSTLCSMWYLSSLPGIKPVSPAWEAQGLNHWTIRGVPMCVLKRFISKLGSCLLGLGILKSEGQASQKFLGWAGQQAGNSEIPGNIDVTVLRQNFFSSRKPQFLLLRLSN